MKNAMLCGLLLLAACGENSPNPSPRERLDYGRCRCAYAIVAAHKTGDRKTINEAFGEQSDYSDAGLWSAVEQLIRAGRIRVVDGGLAVVPPEDWPPVDDDGNVARSSK